MKKVIITTFQRAQNYGAMLQALALERVLTDLGNTVEFLDYRDPHIEEPYRLFFWKGKKNIRWIKNLLRSIYYFVPNIKRAFQFEKFRESQIHLTEKQYRSEEILKNEYPRAEYYITGSDQVWNPDITRGLSDIYTLNFGEEDMNRISYAASIGKNVLNEKEKKELRSKLQKIQQISVREETAKKILEEIFPQKEIQVVLDPTLLLNDNQWNSIIGNKFQDHSKYILAYLVEEDKEFRKIVKDISNKMDCPIIHFERKKFWENSRSCYTDGPIAFIEKIKDAEIVITTSFHATVFSIIFHKKFWVIPHRTTGTRVIDLLKLTGLSNRAVYSLNEFQKKNFYEDIDYTVVDEILAKERKKSIQWLKNKIMN